MSTLTDRVVLISGAGAGVGRALALSMAREGADVALAARTSATLADTAVLIEREGRRALPVPTDVSKAAQVDALMRATLDEFGRLDVLIHSILPPHLLKNVLDLGEEDLDAWRASVETSVFGALLVSRAAAQAMARRRSGSIVFITATSALQGYETVSAHAAGKAGIHSLAQCLTSELGPLGIRVNCVAPGVILGATVRRNIVDPGSLEAFVVKQAGQNALRRMPCDEEVARAALFLASDAAAGITGQILVVDAGRFFH